MFQILIRAGVFAGYALLFLLTTERAHSQARLSKDAIRQIGSAIVDLSNYPPLEDYFDDETFSAKEGRKLEPVLLRRLSRIHALVGEGALREKIEEFPRAAGATDISEWLQAADNVYCTLIIKENPGAVAKWKTILSDHLDAVRAADKAVTSRKQHTTEGQNLNDDEAYTSKTKQIDDFKRRLDSCQATAALLIPSFP